MKRGAPGEEDVSGFTSMGLEQLPSKNASVQNYGDGDLKPLFSAIDRKGIPGGSGRMGGWGECSQPGYGKGVFEEDDPVRGRTYFL